MSIEPAASPADGSRLPFLDLPSPAGQSIEFLSGVRVVDLTTSVAGPYAGMLLGDFGADVVKIERRGSGDDARSWGPPFLDGESLWFLAVNRNKRSVTLDYAKPEGAAILRKLVATADIVLINQPPRVANKLGLSAEAMVSVKPDLIYVSITGFGLTGPRADWTCYDLIAEGYSGVMDLTGEAGGEPQKVGAPAADMLAGQDAAMAAIASLFQRMKTGKGHVIDISLVESMTRFLSCRIMPYLGSGAVSTRSGGKDSVIAIYQAFDTQDHPITLGLGNDNLWSRFWQAVGQPEMANDAAYRSNAQRRAQRVEIVAAIQSILLTQPREHWLKLFQEARIPAGPINRVDEVSADQELQARGLFYRLGQGSCSVPQVGLGIQIDGAPSAPRLPPPRLGADTKDILQGWLSYSAEQIENLRTSEII